MVEVAWRAVKFDPHWKKETIPLREWQRGRRSVVKKIPWKEITDRQRGFSHSQLFFFRRFSKTFLFPPSH
jgi:uncharacterized protein (UPF0248 family)